MLVGPVVSPRPVAEGGSKLRGLGGARVRRIYKCINDFAVVEVGGSPRHEEWGKAYGHS